jgi:hypothetical protein
VSRSGPQGERWVAGTILAVLGGVALAEAYRLRTLRTTLVAGAVVGDDTFPMIVGLALAALGVTVLGLTGLPSVRIDLPRGPVRARMLWAAGVLAAYWAILPYVGYTGSTALASTGLYRAVGAYRWTVAVLLGIATTGVLYLLFRVWLLQPLPPGWLGR